MRIMGILLAAAIGWQPFIVWGQSTPPDELIVAFDVNYPQTFKSIFTTVNAIPGVTVAGANTQLNMILIRLEKPRVSGQDDVIRQLMDMGYLFVVKEGSIEQVLEQMGDSFTMQVADPQPVPQR